MLYELGLKIKEIRHFCALYVLPLFVHNSVVLYISCLVPLFFSDGIFDV